MKTFVVVATIATALLVGRASMELLGRLAEILVIFGTGPR